MSTKFLQLTNGTKLFRVGFGAMRLRAVRTSGSEAWEDSKNVLRRAVSLGVNLVDSAHFYGPANQLLYEALHPYPEPLVIATKVGVIQGENGAPAPGAEPKHIRSVVEKDLETLHLQQLPLVFLRLPGGPLPDSGVPMQDSLGELIALQEEGKIKHIGLSSATTSLLKEASDITPIAAVQNLYNLADRSCHDVLKACEDRNIAFFPYFPLQMGNYGQDTKTISGVEAIAQTHGVTTAQATLAGLLAASPQIVVIPGTSKIKHLEQNVASAAINLSIEERNRLLS